MAQRWPLASRLARDARMPCAPARGAPVVSTPEAPCPTRASPHARSPCCLAHCAPRRQARGTLEQETATKATEEHESMVDSIEAAPTAAKDAHARHPRPAPNRTETVPPGGAWMRTYPWIPPQYLFFLRMRNTEVCAIPKYVQYPSMCNTRPYASMCNTRNTLTYHVPRERPIHRPIHPDTPSDASLRFSHSADWQCVLSLNLLLSL